MKRNRGLGLFTIFAMLALAYPVSPVMASVDHLAITADTRVQSGSTCLSGAKKDCTIAAESAFLDCADSFGLTYEDLENGHSGFYTCALWGGLAYLWCSFTSIFS